MLAQNRNKAPVFYLPLGQTVYQKCLIDILIQLHKPHITEYLLTQREHLLNSAGTRESSVKKEEEEEKEDVGSNHKPETLQPSYMSDESMFEAFIFNYKQITNHPTLLVDHYIPRNFLLLSSKENIINLSNKYHQVSEILDKLVERNVRKTIVISVSNAKEMDLVESFLLGKCGIQYYRFSGSSLYYDNHGSFDFHKASKLNNESLNEPYSGRNVNNSSDISVAGNGNGNTGDAIKLKRKAGRAKKGNRISGNEVIDATTGEVRRKKKLGRPTSAEKKAREQQAQVSAALEAEYANGKAQSVDNGKNLSNNETDETHKSKENKEEYIPKLSKNNREFTDMLAEKRSKKLNVYLILSSQLKYLLQLEDLKSDMVFSLDSNFTDFEDLSNSLTYEIPIIKPIVVDSLEHYEWEMSKEPLLFSDSLDPPSTKRQRRAAAVQTFPSSIGSAEKDNTKLEGVNKSKFHRLLALLAIASWADVEVESQSNLSPVSEKLIDWLADWNSCTYPYGDGITTVLPHKFDDALTDKVLKVLDSPYDLTNTLGVNEMDQYQFFNSQLKSDLNGDINSKTGDIETESKGSKRIKLSPKLEHVVKQIPQNFTYQQYQFQLTTLINDTLQAMLSWMQKTEKCLQFVNLDETERQSVIDQGYVECGELFKKDRDLGVKIEAREKIRQRMKNEYIKFEATRDCLRERIATYNEITTENIDFSKQEAEIDELRTKIESLKADLKKSEAESETIRHEYQEKSSHAAELSSAVKQAQELGKLLTDQSQGTFQKIQLQSLFKEQEFVSKKVTQLKDDELFWNRHISTIQNELDKRSSGINADGHESTGRGSGRGRTPH